MKIYTIFWLTGKTQLIKGSTPEEAMNNAGIGAGALRAMDFYANDDQRNNYLWNKEERNWDMTKEYRKIKFGR